MRISVRRCFLPFAALLLACTAVPAQTGNFFQFQPATLSVGNAPVDLVIYGANLSPGTIIRWNGENRPTAQGPMGSGSFKLSLTAGDVGRPGLAEITAFDPRIGSVFPNVGYIAVGYNVAPVATVYDRIRRRFYVATPTASQDANFPANSVVAFDPEAGTFGPSHAAGTVLGDMVLSDDGSALYVVLESESSVRRLDAATLTRVSEFRFRPAGATGGRAESPFTTAIAALPGRPGTIALHYHPQAGSSLAQNAIFDDGVKRPNEIVCSDGYNGLLFSPGGRYLFEGNFQYIYGSRSVARYTFDAAGFPGQTPVYAPGGGPATIIDGVLYTSGGTMIDVATMEMAGNLGMSGSIAVDPANARILIMGEPAYSGVSLQPLQAFHLPTQEPLGSFRLGGTGNIGSTNRSLRLYRYGSDSVVYRSTTHLLAFHTPLAAPAPTFEAAGVTNAASFVAGSITPGEILSLYGENLGPGVGRSFTVSATGSVDAPQGANVQVWFDGTPGTVLYASGRQVNVIAPFSLQAGTTVRVQVWYFGIPSRRIPMQVVAAAPALFTRDGSGRGSVAVVNQDGSINSPSPPGSIISVFGTGGGPTASGTDGTLARSANSLLTQPRVLIGGEQASVLYAGAAPGLVNGVFQINARVPSSARSGSTLPIVVELNGRQSPQGVTVAIR